MHLKSESIHVGSEESTVSDAEETCSYTMHGALELGSTQDSFSSHYLSEIY